MKSVLHIISSSLAELMATNKSIRLEGCFQSSTITEREKIYILRTGSDKICSLLWLEWVISSRAISFSPT